jgi:hypothetical protein
VAKQRSSPASSAKNRQQSKVTFRNVLDYEAVSK